MIVVSDKADIMVDVSEISKSCILKVMRSNSKRAESKTIFDYMNKHSAFNGNLDDVNKVIDKMYMRARAKLLKIVIICSNQIKSCNSQDKISYR